MPRKPKRYPIPTPPQTEYIMTPAEALLPPSGKTETGATPSWALKVFLNWSLREHSKRNNKGLLLRLLALLQKTPLFLDTLDRQDPSILQQLGGREKVLEELLRRTLRERRTCSDSILKLHAGYLQSELYSWESVRASRPWLVTNLPRLFQGLSGIPCECKTRTRVTNTLLDDLLCPQDISGPTSTSLLYAILGYHHDNVKPNTIKKRLIKLTPSPPKRA